MADWSRELNVNEEVLDPQHVEIFKKISEAEEALDGTREELDAAFAALADVLVDHLAAEERMMEETLYPERKRHRSAHELFMADFLQMRDELRENGVTEVVADWIERRIPEWLRFHIRVNDLPLAEYLGRRRAHSGALPRSENGPQRLS